MFDFELSYVNVDNLFHAIHFDYFIICILYIGFPMQAKPLVGLHATGISLHDSVLS